MQIDPSTPLDIPLSKLPNFDPRLVPVFSIDAHLPRVGPEALTAEALARRFAEPPAWEPELRNEPAFEANARDPVPASVLVPIVMRERPALLLTERTTHLSTHSGQIAFPGGKQDRSDADAVDTALREAHEEVGLAREMAYVIGSLPTYITASRFLITPVVALVRPEHSLTLNAAEVADAFEVPLEFLMNPSHHRRHRLEWGGGAREWFSMPYMEDRIERFIWGATAGMLRNFYRFMSA